MTEDELHSELRSLIRQLPGRRWRNACAMLARRAAMAAAGPSWQDYFEEHRHRLLEDAAELIATRSSLAKYRRR